MAYVRGVAGYFIVALLSSLLVTHLWTQYRLRVIVATRSGVTLRRYVVPSWHQLAAQVRSSQVILSKEQQAARFDRIAAYFESEARGEEATARVDVDEARALFQTSLAVFLGQVTLALALGISSVRKEQRTGGVPASLAGGSTAPLMPRAVSHLMKELSTGGVDGHAQPMTAGRSVFLLAGLVLLAGGAGHSDIPIIALLGIPMAAAGACLIGAVALSFSDPSTAMARRVLGTFFLVIGTIALLLSCVVSVVDVQNHLLATERQEMAIAKRSLNFEPNLRFLAGWPSSFEGLLLPALWLGPPILLFIGAMLRQGASKHAQILLFLCWLASAPLSVLVLLLAYLGGEPLSA